MRQQYTNMDGEDNRAIHFKGVKYGRKGKKKHIERAYLKILPVVTATMPLATP